MATLKSNGNEVYKVVSPGTSGLSVNDTVNSTGVTVNSPFSDLKLNRQGDVEPATYLTFTANTAGSTVEISSGYESQIPSWVGYYSTDNGTTWTTYVPRTTGAITLTNIGDSVCFKGVLNEEQIYYKYLKFVMTGSISASGNIMSFCSGDNYASTTTIPYDSCFLYLFQGCSSLTTAPALPATTLAYYCYGHMFQGCTSLTTAPALPATTLASACYEYLFQGCSSLTAAPALPATTLADDCYSGMFSGCTSLTTPPALPATTLAERCYGSMFQGCSSLTSAPALPATTLAESYYWGMFQGCTSLYVSDTSGTGYDKAWRIPTSGTFTNTCEQSNMFQNCLGTRSSDTMAGAQGQSYTYYTQNTPV